MYSEEELEQHKQLAEERHNENPPSWFSVHLKNCLVAGAFGSLIVILPIVELVQLHSCVAHHGLGRSTQLFGCPRTHVVIDSEFTNCIRN